MNFIRFNNWGFLPPILILCNSNTLNPLVFYFILEDRLVPKAILCHTKRRQHFIFSSAMLQMIKYKKSMKFSNKIKLNRTGEQKNHISSYKYSLYRCYYTSFGISNIIVLTFKKRKCHEIWLSSTVRTTYLNNFYSVNRGNL